MNHIVCYTHELLDVCDKEGLYLIFDDSTILPLNKDRIEQISKDFWLNPELISDEVKEAANFQRCEFCPLKKLGGLCDAIRPIMPFLADIDGYMSHSDVIAVFNDPNGNMSVRKTTMQEALKYLSVLSLMYYCRIGRTYWKYFLGIKPLMSAEDIAFHLYLNFYFLNNGNTNTVVKLLKRFKEQIFVTSTNQVKRMNLVCKNDAFMNSYVNTHIITEMLSFNFHDVLQKLFETSSPPDIEPLRC